MIAYLAVLRLLNRDVRFLLAMWAFTSFAYFGITGVLLNLYLLRLGFGPDFIGLLIGSGQLVWAACALPAGVVGLRIGLRNALLAAELLLALGAALMLFVEWAPLAWQAGWLIGGWMVLWVGAALMTVNATPYLMARTGLAERNHAFALQQAVIGLFALLGSFVAGVLPSLVSTWLNSGESLAAPFRISLWLAPLFYLGAFCAVMGMQSIPALPRETTTETKPQAPWAFLISFVLLTFLVAASEGCLRAFFNVYLDRRLGLQVSQIGGIMGVSQVLPVLVALAAPLIMARLGTVRTIWTAAAGAALGLALIALVPTWLAASAGFMLVIAVNSVGATARNIFGQESVPVQWRTTSSALVTVGLALGWALMAAGGGLMAAQLGYRALFLTGATMAAGAAGLAIAVWGRAPAERPAPAETGA